MEGRIYSNEEVLNIAKEQKTICWLFLGSLLSYPLLLIYVGVVTLIIFSIWAIFAVYHLALALKKKNPGLYALGMFFPIIKFFILLNVIQDATKVLRQHDIEVGLMGAKKNSLCNKFGI